MKIYIGADHRGFELKNKLKDWLTKTGYEVEDCGNTKNDPLDDYVDFANCVAEKVAESAVILNSFQDPVSSNEMPKQVRHDNALGIVICGSGVGVSVAANRHKRIICALGFDIDQVKHARENDSINVLSIPSDFVNLEKSKEMISAFINGTPKTEEKYLRRLQKLDL